MSKRFHISTGTRLVSAVPDLDWDRWLGELKAKKEAREALLSENEKHHAKDVAGDRS